MNAINGPVSLMMLSVTHLSLHPLEKHTESCAVSGQLEEVLIRRTKLE
jgi:hypothetical protein